MQTFHLTNSRPISVGVRGWAARLPALAGLGGLTCAALAVCATSAFAATGRTSYDVFGFNSPDHQAGEIFSQRLEDVSLGGRVRDLFASSYLADLPAGHDSAAIPGAGEVTLINSKDRSKRYEIFSPEPQANANFGFYLANIGDVNGDGKDDLAVGAPGESVDAAGKPCTAGTAGCNENAGKVFVIQGSTGKLLYAIKSPDPQSHPGSSFRGFGARIGTAGDVNGDRVPDIIVGASSYDSPSGCSNLSPLPADCHKGEGEAFILSGKNGSLIRTLHLPPSDKPAGSCSVPKATTPCGSFGGSVQSPGDLNGDGVPDQLVSAYSLRPTPDRGGRVYLFSGKNGSVLTRIDAPEAGPNQFFGLQDVARNTPGDVNRDGVPDIYISAFNQVGTAGPGQGKAWVFDGKASVATGHGVVRYQVKDPTPTASEAFGFAASKTDYNKDGTPDLFVGGIGPDDREVYIINGKNGSALKTLALPGSAFQRSAPDNDGSELGTSSRALGDINHDGEPDFVGGAAYQDVGGKVDEGKVFFFVSSVPAVTKFGLTNRRFGVVGAPSRNKHPRGRSGTTFTYTLSKAATVKIVVAHRLAGRRQGRRCVAPTRNLRRAKGCTRILVRGRLTRRSRRGANRLPFSGRIRRRALSAGRYSATITATDATKTVSAPRVISFTIIKR